MNDIVISIDPYESTDSPTGKGLAVVLDCQCSDPD